MGENVPGGSLEAVGDEFAAAGRLVNAVDVARPNLGVPRDAFVIAVNAVGRVGEPHGTVGRHREIVRAVEPPAVPSVGEHCAPCVVLGPDYPTQPLLTGDQAAVRVECVAVRKAGRFAEDTDRAVGLVPTHQAVVRDVAPQQVAPGGDVDRPLRPPLAGRDPPDSDVAAQAVERGMHDLVGVNCLERQCRHTPSSSLSVSTSEGGARRRGRHPRVGGSLGSGRVRQRADPGYDVAVPAQARLLGRDRETAVVGHALSEASSSRSSIVIVEGEPGIGKSRLLSEADDAARRHDMQVAAGRAEELDQGRPFGVMARSSAATPRPRTRGGPGSRGCLRRKSRTTGARSP